MCEVEGRIEGEELAPLGAEKAVSPLVSVRHLVASWSQDKDKLVLKDISFEVTSAAPLMAVVGPVGAGKVRQLTA